MAFKMKGSPMQRNYGVGGPMNKKGDKELSKFEKAFAAARKAGKKTFEFEGKSYNTAEKGEGIMFHEGGTTYVQDSSGDQYQYRSGGRKERQVQGEDGIWRYE